VTSESKRHKEMQGRLRLNGETEEKADEGLKQHKENGRSRFAVYRDRKQLARSRFFRTTCSVWELLNLATPTAICNHRERASQ
jgi:hypothetical protein